MKNIDIQELSIGTKVYWHDPAGETSGIYEILIMPDIEEMTNEKLEYDDLILLKYPFHSFSSLLAIDLLLLHYPNLMRVYLK